MSSDQEFSALLKVRFTHYVFFRPMKQGILCNTINLTFGISATSQEVISGNQGVAEGVFTARLGFGTLKPRHGLSLI